MSDAIDRAETGPDSSAAAETEPADAATGTVPVPPPAVDPWKGLRGVFAGTLVLEAIVVALALLVVGRLGDGAGSLGWTFVLVLVVLLMLAAGVQGRSWGLTAALGLQGLLLAVGLIEPFLFIPGVPFVLVWAALVWFKHDVARRMDEGLLPSQQQAQD
ncbi:DUF4233 domain-containing protein [Actinoalloteichus hymeniacidonis]|uniref:DUF4233 family protein n=1 Tax=Actinoalloteichus hymeniacidonis TaxID=340345 RepID=A0AAC9HND1_9PSEU|nr:DUF4233 domain-containing protein [Actinoalloteichus hymeniacidonis]AOS62437.1 putative DUF4233 family protein [Actinoalloteichus hymeniacidonis]MBB5909532.1 hypothetical protein [Actinoalloteichus hymeniacidonis]